MNWIKTNVCTNVYGYSRAGEPEPVFLAARSRSRLRKKPGAAAGAAKKTWAGAGAAQRNQEPEPLKKKQEPEPPKLGGPGSLWLIIKQIGTGAPLTPPLLLRCKACWVIEEGREDVTPDTTP